jgi:hypothetical protein
MQPLPRERGTTHGHGAVHPVDSSRIVKGMKHPDLPVILPYVTSTVLQAPTAEMRTWQRRLQALFRDDSLLGVALVTPIAHFANRSAGFQTYLYAIFHRTWPARLGHAVLMPTIVTAALAWAAMWSSWLATGLSLSMAAWYVAMARREHMALLGVVSVGSVAFMLPAASYWGAAAVAGAVHPGLVLVLAALGQTLSHAAEPDVPPRVSETNRWVPIAEYFAHSPVRRAFRSALMVPAGMANEIWASWRLLPVVWLDLLWRLGYQPQARAAHRRLVAQACEHGNPAIDFIGEGGACLDPYQS